MHSWPAVGTAVGTARAGNEIGGGDWALDRIERDLVRAWSAGEEADPTPRLCVERSRVPALALGLRLR